jgi:hypothetical protein
MKLRLGIVTPVIHINPRFHPPSWETTGTIDDIVVVAQEAERLGYDWVSASEHIAIPTEATGARGPRYWDPVAALSYIAAHTRRIALLSHIVVLSYHHPLEIVKRWGTVDVLSHGRVILGVGVGSLEPEFELLGHQFAGRGERGDDSLRAIRAAWGERTPTYEGTHFRYSGFIVEPSALFADQAIQESLAARERPLQMILAPEPPIDPAGDPGGTADFLRTYVEVGATGLSLRFDHHSRTHYIEQMEALQEVVRAL